MGKPQKPAPGASSKGGGYRTFFLLLFAALLALNWWLWHYASRRSGGAGAQPAAVLTPFRTKPDLAVFASYGGSKSCEECHPEAYRKWSGSHHALAERPVSLVADRPAFDPPRTFKHGTQTTEVRTQGDRLEVVTLGLDGKKAYPVQRVIGVSPLRQFLVAEPRGRLQVTEVATDTETGQWFNVYGDEDRQPGEWGHWSGRGMTWNTMCAFCHNMRVRKNYNPATDTFSTQFREQGVGCESCHGPMADHVAWQKQHPKKKGDPTLHRFTWKQTLHYCASCHSRRNEITGDFVAGEDYFDHYLLPVPDDTDTYYPDGQVRDENFEITAFLASRMHNAGVKCMDCHDPHLAKLLAKDNALCLRCHIKPPDEFKTAPVIDPAKHSFHKPNTSGDACVDCHMPLTLYMARHWRRDHGYTIPDPLLTKQHGIPNACNRCHKDKTVDWSMEYCDQWYGAKMNRPSRTRAQWVAEARAGATNTWRNMLTLLREEKIPLWRTVAATFLKFQPDEPGVANALLKAADDPEPLVRAAAVQALEFVPTELNATIEPTLRAKLRDPSRSVRTRAAWALRRTVDTNSVAAQDLMHSLAHNADHPTGQLQMGVWHMDRGDLDTALVHFQRAVQWDQGSPALRHALAVALSLQGRHEDAVRELETAVQLAPRDAEMRYKLGLAYNEVGRIKAASTALEQAVKLGPQLPRAWYNLGLAYAEQNQLEDAVRALSQAEKLEPASPQIPYARATVLARQGRLVEARAAAQRALQLHPSYPEAILLLQQLSR